MPTPVGHSLAGAALYLGLSRAQHPLADWRAGLLCVASASAADLDFLVGGAAGEWSRFHQGASHSATMAIVFGLVMACWPLRSLGSWRRRWVLFTLLYASHLALDVVTLDARPPYGIPALWPLWSAYVHAPLDLFPTVRRDTLVVILSPANWWGVVVEVFLLAPVTAAVAFLRSRGRP